MGLGFRLFGGVSQKKLKAARERYDDKLRELARAKAYARPWNHGCCARCGVPLKLKPSEARHEFEIAHGHEIVPRSQGGDPNDSRNVIILCFRCHLLGSHKQTSNEAEWFVIVILNAELGADDPNGIAFESYRRQHVS